MDEQQMRRAIERKREGEALDAQTWSDIIASYMNDAIDDAQMAAMAMAALWRGLSIPEAHALTVAMVASGKTLTYPPGLTVVDKHSTGGVSDIVSLIAVPLVAACGVRVAKLSGRALGHTGGTIDKLETIPGINLTPSVEAFVRQVETVGCAIAAQTDAFVPADKRLYKLRDRTATVPSLGLIASSIVSKKVAAGASAFVFDVKCGSASFMKTPEQAIDLARALVAISKEFGKKARAIVSDMNEPLGHAIGSGIEIIEARDFLRGVSNDARVRDVCMRIATTMLELGGKPQDAKTLEAALENGAAYQKFCDMIEAQGGDVRAFEAMRTPTAFEKLHAETDGYISAIDAVLLGTLAREWSAREATAGIRTFVRVGQGVSRGDLLAECFGEESRSGEIRPAFKVAHEAPPSRKPVIAEV